MEAGQKPDHAGRRDLDHRSPAHHDPVHHDPGRPAPCHRGSGRRDSGPDACGHVGRSPAHPAPRDQFRSTQCHRTARRSAFSTCRAEARSVMPGFSQPLRFAAFAGWHQNCPEAACRGHRHPAGRRGHRDRRGDGGRRGHGDRQARPARKGRTTCAAPCDRRPERGGPPPFARASAPARPSRLNR